MVVMVVMMIPATGRHHINARTVTPPMTVMVMMMVVVVIVPLR
jgi:hypothetical protein